MLVVGVCDDPRNQHHIVDVRLPGEWLVWSEYFGQTYVGSRCTPVISRNAIGSPSASAIRVGTALPLRQSGSSMASAGMMQWWPCFQASRKHGLLEIVSLRAL